MHRRKSLYCTLSAVDVILSLLSFFINTSRYTSTTTSMRVLREVSYSKRPHGDLQLLYFTVSSKLPVMSFACRNCPRGAIQAQEEVLDPCCEPYVQSSPSLAFFTGSKKTWDWMSNGSLQSYSLAAFSCRGGQSVITHFCVDELSELQISLVGELRPLHWFWWDARGIHIQLKPLKLFPVMDAWLDKVLH